MSSGHTHVSRAGMSASDVDKILANPQVKANLARPVTLNREYDLPYLAGYSQDGNTIYFDRHLPTDIKIGNREIDPAPTLEVHERTEKAIIDALHYKYAAAHEIATACERRAVVKAGINWNEYQNALKPFIKADEREKVARTPPNLDLTPYEGDKPLLQHIREHEDAKVQI